MRVSLLADRLLERWHRSVARDGLLKTLVHSVCWHSSSLLFVIDLTSDYSAYKAPIPLIVQYVSGVDAFDRLGLEPRHLEWSGMADGQLRDALRRGLVLLMLLTPEGKCVYMSWIVVAPCRGPLPYSFPVDYASEAATGGAITNPEFRRLGLYTFAHATMYRILRDSGKKRVRFGPFEKKELARGSQEKLGARIDGIGHMMTLFGSFRLTWVSRPHSDPHDESAPLG